MSIVKQIYHKGNGEIVSEEVEVTTARVLMVYTMMITEIMRNSWKEWKFNDNNKIYMCKTVITKCIIIYDEDILIIPFSK